MKCSLDMCALDELDEEAGRGCWGMLICSPSRSGWAFRGSFRGFASVVFSMCGSLCFFHLGLQKFSPSIQASNDVVLHTRKAVAVVTATRATFFVKMQQSLRASAHAHSVHACKAICEQGSLLHAVADLWLIGGFAALAPRVRDIIIVMRWFRALFYITEAGLAFSEAVVRVRLLVCCAKLVGRCGWRRDLL